jgi:hypothetical protein
LVTSSGSPVEILRHAAILNSSRPNFAGLGRQIWCGVVVTVVVSQCPQNRPATSTEARKMITAVTSLTSMLDPITVFELGGHHYFE